MIKEVSEVYTNADGDKFYFTTTTTHTGYPQVYVYNNIRQAINSREFFLELKHMKVDAGNVIEG